MRLDLSGVETGFHVRSHVDRINEGENILLEKYPYMCGLGLKDVVQGRDSLTFNQQQIELAFLSLVKFLSIFQQTQEDKRNSWNFSLSASLYLELVHNLTHAGR